MLLPVVELNPSSKRKIDSPLPQVALAVRNMLDPRAHHSCDRLPRRLSTVNAPNLPPADRLHPSCAAPNHPLRSSV